MPEIKIGAIEENYSTGPSLLDILRDMDIVVESPCGGKGICGKCKVTVLGKTGPISHEEKAFLKEEEIKEGVRLACLTYPEGNIEVLISRCKEEGLSILTEGTIADFTLDPPLKWQDIELQRPNTKEGKSLLDCLEDKLGPVEVDLKIMTKLPGAFDSSLTAISYNRKLIDLIEGESRGIFGLAIDIGTTTVVTTAVCLKSGEVIGSRSSVNPQKDYGLDVISRIDYAQNTPGGLIQLRDSIRRSINKMIHSLCDDTQMEINRIYDVTVAANATMTTLLLGLDPTSLGRAPFSPVFRRSLTIKASEIGIETAQEARLFVLPGVSAYIGSDIVAGIVATELKEKEGKRLFIDIGTNGEIVLSIDGRLSACSCAAGPALEGMNISCGMRASEGAIESVKLTDPPEIKVIGKEEPKGLCGSAILETMSELVKRKKINRTGKLLDSEIAIVPGISLTQKDIRQVQLARGAILSGFIALLEVKGLAMEDLEEVIVAGQFGKHLSRESLTGSGLIPAELEDRISYCGNTSSTGALMCLLSKEAREKTELASSEVDYIELSTLDDYDRLFSRCLKFKV